MKKQTYLLQDEIYSCGAYCLKMILNYFSIDEEIDQVKQQCRMNASGISMFGLIDAFKYYHIEAGGYEVDLDYLQQHMSYPCILHTVNEQYQHYIVLYECKKGKYLCADPAQGKVVYTYGELKQIYTGKAIVVTFVSKPPKTSSTHFIPFIYQTVRPLGKQILRFACFAWISVLLALVNQILFKKIFDCLEAKEGFLGFFILFLLIFFIHYFFQKKREEYILELEASLNEQTLFKAMRQLLHLEKGFYERYLVQETAGKIQTLYELPHYLLDLGCFLGVDFVQIILFSGYLGFLHINLLFSLLPFLIVELTYSILTLKKMSKQDKRVIIDYEALQNDVVDHIEHQKDFQNFQLVARQNQILDTKINHFFSNYRLKREMNLNYSILSLLFYQGMSMVILIVAGLLYNVQKLTLGDVFIAYSLSHALIEPLMKSSEIIVNYKRNETLFERLKIFNLTYKEKEKQLNSPIESIEFDNVSFSYGYRKATLDHFQGLFMHHYYVVGENGSGKSTFLKLIAGDYSNYQGTIFVNQVNLKNLGQNEIQDKICYLSENGYFKNQTVLEFLVGDDLQLQTKLFKWIQRFELFELSEIINKSVDQKGQGLSKGQMQFIQFLKVVLLDYEVYLFDESFNHLSENLRQKVERMIESDLLDKKVVFIVDHQIKDVEKSKRCVIIKQGRLSEI